VDKVRIGLLCISYQFLPTAQYGCSALM